MNIPHVKYDKGKVEGYKRRIQEILGTLDAPNSPLGENLRVGGCAPHLAFVGPHSTATTFVCESGTSPNFDPRPSSVLYSILIAPHTFLFLNPNTLACRRLIRRAFTPHEFPSLIEAIFSSKDEDDAISCLLGDDAQTFIDVIDEARPTLSRHKSVNLN